MNHRFLLLCTWVLASFTSCQNPFESEIRKFEELDKENPSRAGQILFTGSSSIRMWKSLDVDFSDAEVLNRGFGGSQFQDLLFYYDRIIVPYRPGKILIYEGDNDIANGQSAVEVFENFKVLVKKLQTDFPSIKIAFIAIKPSPSRWDLHKEMEHANRVIRDYCESTGLTFIDVYSPMLQQNKPNPDYYVSDSLHMSPAGYAVWTSKVKPFVYN